MASTPTRFVLVVVPGKGHVWPTEMFSAPRLDCRHQMPADPAHRPSKGVLTVDLVVPQPGFALAVRDLVQLVTQQEAGTMVCVLCNHAKHRSPVVAAFAADLLREAHAHIPIRVFESYPCYCREAPK